MGDYCVGRRRRRFRTWCVPWGWYLYMVASLALRWVCSVEVLIWPSFKVKVDSRVRGNAGWGWNGAVVVELTGAGLEHKAGREVALLPSSSRRRGSIAFVLAGGAVGCETAWIPACPGK